MSEELKLKPCPFCGAELIFEKYDPGLGKTSKTKWILRCPCYCFSLFGYTKRELLQRTSKRPAEDALRQRIAELERTIDDLRGELAQSSPNPIWHGPEEVPEEGDEIAFLTPSGKLYAGCFQGITERGIIVVQYPNAEYATADVFTKWAYVRDLEALK